MLFEKYYTVFIVERKSGRERTWKMIAVKSKRSDAAHVVETGMKLRPENQYRVSVAQAFTKN